MQMQITNELISVYRLPQRLTNGFAFGAGVPIEFTNVDWFNAYEGLTREALEKFVRAKRYCTPGRYLVMADTPEYTFRFSV